jgi:hypothetical protein
VTQLLKATLIVENIDCSLTSSGPSFHSLLRVSMDWFGLSKELQSLLSGQYSSPLLLQSAFDDRNEAEELLKQVAGGKLEAAELERLSNQLAVWATVNRARFKRARRDLVVRCREQGMTVAKVVLSSQDVYTQLCTGQIAVIKTRHRSTLANVLNDELDPRHREDAEERERNHWVRILAQFMIDGNLPSWRQSTVLPVQLKPGVACLAGDVPRP